jgi:hypothetical protein
VKQSADRFHDAVRPGVDLIDSLRS